MITSKNSDCVHTCAREHFPFYRLLLAILEKLDNIHKMSVGDSNSLAPPLGSLSQQGSKKMRPAQWGHGPALLAMQACMGRRPTWPTAIHRCMGRKQYPAAQGTPAVRGSVQVCAVQCTGRADAAAAC